MNVAVWIMILVTPRVQVHHKFIKEKKIQTNETQITCDRQILLFLWD